MTDRSGWLVDALDAALAPVVHELYEARLTRLELNELAHRSMGLVNPDFSYVLRHGNEFNSALEFLAVNQPPVHCGSWFGHLVTTLACLLLLWEQDRRKRSFCWLGRSWPLRDYLSLGEAAP